ARGMFTAKVCSWCVSRLGGSAARATRNTPPRCGFSSARANDTAHSPTHTTMASNSTSILQLLIHSPPHDALPGPCPGRAAILFSPVVVKVSVSWQDVPAEPLVSVLLQVQNGALEAGPRL